MRVGTLFLAGLVVLVACPAFSQMTSTGTITGRVVDPDGLPLPGVVVTVSSPALQGSRVATTSGYGDYIVPFLPAGQYEVLFERAGFAPGMRSVRVQVADTVTLNANMSVGGFAESVAVNVQADFTGTATGGASYRADLIDRLPIARDLSGPVLLAPGTTASGPGGALTLSGAWSYEGRFHLDGAVLNETARNQPRPIVIEDAIEEVSILTSAISAEYGLFSGGVANAITRSGGNVFSGSLRTTLDNDSWRSLTPFEGKNGIAPARDTVPTYESTFGGPILRDKLWFFLAARHREQEVRQTTRYTNLPYEQAERDRRFEAKGTWSIARGHRVAGAYLSRNLVLPDASTPPIMDLASLFERREQDRLLSTSYTGVIAPTLFLEAHYSQRQYRIRGLGSRFTDLVRGTLIVDRSRDGARWNSPTFCGVCGPEGTLTEEIRDNRNVAVKASRYWSSETMGAHHVVFGADAFEDRRQNDNWQSGSGYRLVTTGTLIRDEGRSLYPVVQAGTTPTQASAAYLQWNPIFLASRGSSLRTYSVFLNDGWTLSRHWSVNLGARWDRTDAHDQAGKPVSGGHAWSPRLGIVWDPRGSGRWSLNGGFARYVMGMSSTIADLGSGAGRSSSFRYVYQGPSINLDPSAAQLVSAPDALTAVFDWFFTNGATSRPLRDAPTYAGLNRVAGDDLAVPTAYEFSLGIRRRLGSRGSLRFDGIFRDFRDSYAERKDLTSGRATDPRGQQYDLGLIVNTNRVEKRYRALQTQWQYALPAGLDLGGNYTLASAVGNFDGEFEASGPVPADALLYPEYGRAEWSYPTGRLAIDERHNLRMWVDYRLPLGHISTTAVAVLHHVTSGPALSDVAPVAVGAYITNPGYLTPPPIGAYFLGGRGNVQTAAITATDLSVHWSMPVRGAKPRVFARLILGNVFNRSAVRRPDTTILTAILDPTLVQFNPFTQTPVEGVHFRRGPLYGQALSADGWQRPRWFGTSAGIRF